MRITSNTVHQRLTQNLQRQLSGIDDAHLRVLTGRRINAASDDPASAADVLTADSRMRALTQYRRNIESAQSRLAAEESALNQLTDIVSRAMELAVSQGTDTASAATRSTTAAEVDELLKAVIQLGNTQFAGRFLFGGAYATEAPLTAEGDLARPVADPGTHDSPVAVDRAQMVLTTHDAGTVFVESDVIQALRDLSAALRSNDRDAVGGLPARFSAGITTVQDRLGEVGARTNRLESATANIDALAINVASFRSTLAEADFEAAITDLVNRQTAFQAALAATSRMLSTTLTDYLR